MNKPWHPSETRMLRTMAELTPEVAKVKARKLAQVREARMEMRLDDSGVSQYGWMVWEHDYMQRVWEWRLPHINTVGDYQNGPS